MNTDIQLLINLQSVDLKIAAFKGEIDAVPGEIEELRQAFLKAQKDLQDLLEEMDQDEQKRKSLERTVEDEKEALAKSRLKIPEVKTNKEYTALLSEIENMEKAIYDTEDEILNLMELTEEKATLKKETEEVVKRENEHFNKLKDQKEKELAEFSSGLEVETAKREQVADGIKRPLLEKYERLKQARNGVAVMNVVESVCQGCHMTIPPQVVAEIMTGEDVINCEHCNRILFITP